MAPEVLNDLPYSFEADVYSFSVLLWQLLAWKPAPYRAGNLGVIVSHLSREALL